MGAFSLSLERPCLFVRSEAYRETMSFLKPDPAQHKDRPALVSNMDGSDDIAAQAAAFFKREKRDGAGAD